MGERPAVRTRASPPGGIGPVRLSCACGLESARGARDQSNSRSAYSGDLVPEVTALDAWADRWLALSPDADGDGTSGLGIPGA